MTAGWRVEITPPARRDLRRIDPPVRKRIIDALDRLVGDPPSQHRSPPQTNARALLWRRVRLPGYVPSARCTAPKAGLGCKPSSSSVAAPIPCCVSEIHERPSVKPQNVSERQSTARQAATICS